MASKDFKQEVTEVEIQGDNHLAKNTKLGIEKDELPLKTIILWALAMIVVIIGFFVILPYSFNIATSIKQEDLSVNAEYYMIKELKEKDANALTTFGIVDKEAGIYRIPVDSVINMMAVD
jgi:hypothetical protein